MKDYIGIFDSGVGGLSLYRWIHQRLPDEHYLYFADSKYAPYGDKPLAMVYQRCAWICQYFIERGAKAIVIACNTATAACVNELRQEFSLPIIAVEPAVKVAVELADSRAVGVLATENTIASERFRRLVEENSRGKDVYMQACPGLVELIEAGMAGMPPLRERLKQLLAPLIERDIDTLVLGCTHYPFVLQDIAALAPGLTIVEPGEAVARQLERQLITFGLRQLSSKQGITQFVTTGNADHVANISSNLLAYQHNYTFIDDDMKESF